METRKPIIGYSCGDLNGIGLEVILKAVADQRLLDHCTPVIFASNKTVNFYRKGIKEININFSAIKDFSKINPKQVNVFNCWEEEVTITPGELNEVGGQYAIMSLMAATAALKNKEIDALVTAPIHKKNVQSEQFAYTGHTPFLRDFFAVPDVAMFMVAENLRVALVTEHVPVQEVANHLQAEHIVRKLRILQASLQQDFGIAKPKIAVLALNPHAGDEGLIGQEEINIIKPAIQQAKQQNILAFGPYPADGFFARGHYAQFDAVLAMYHDQGLIPFKSLAIGEGVNYTAGMPVVRTSPDHGTAFDIAGQDKASGTSTLEATFTAIDILQHRNQFAEDRKNPLKKVSHRVIGNVDERIEE